MSDYEDNSRAVPRDVDTNEYDFGYKVHPLLEVLPLGDIDALLADIGTHGQRVPVLVTADDAMLIDGRARIIACRRLGIEPRIERLPVLSETELTAAVVSANLHRRHWGTGQRAVIAAELEEPIGAMREQWTNPSSDLQGKRTREIAAKWFGVGEGSVEQATVLLRRAPRLAEAVKLGQKSLNSVTANCDGQRQRHRQAAPVVSS